MIKDKAKKLVSTFLFLCGIFVSSYYFWGLDKKDGLSSVCIKNNCFSLEIADSLQERERGLMNREHLEKGKGMLFVFKKEGIYKFWMKNTLIPLDIIWIDGAGKVVYIKEEARPCKTDLCESFGPDEKAKYVLEINGGTVSRLQTKIGDVAIIEN